MSHEQLAAELHVSVRTTQDLFDDAWKKGFISREHFFKKNGKRVMSAEPYIKANSHGMGEYLGSRYWVNWDVIRAAQAPKPPDGVAEIATPNSDGVEEISTPNSQIGVAKIATPVAKIATKDSKQYFVITSQSKSTTLSACATTVTHAGTSAPEATDASDTAQHTQRCFSKQAVQTAPPTAVTCEAGVPSASGLEKQQGVQLQAAVSRIAKAKLGNHRHIPKNLGRKFELLVIAYGVAVASRDFTNWCDENITAKKKMTYPIHEYIKVVDSRFGKTPAEDSQAVGDIEELSALSYSLTDTLTTTKQKNQIAKVLKEFPVATIKTALVYYVEHLREEPTSATMNLFWKVENIYAVLKAESKLREATEGDEDLRKARPMQHDLQALKRNVGTLPFAQRLVLDHQGYAACPFHDGDGERSFHISRTDDGVGLGRCFSDCAKTFDAIAFVEKFDKVSTGESIRKLVSLVGDIDNGSASAGLPPKPPPSPMTAEVWAKSGRAVTDTDAATLAASRPASVTPSAATLNAMGFKMGAYGHLIAPYRLGDIFHTLKARTLTTKKFFQENAVSQHGLFNIDAVIEGCDVTVVESELDAAVLYQLGYTAVSVISASQRDIEPDVLTKLLTARRIYLVGDSDEAGTTCMDALAKLLPAEKSFRLFVPDGFKDIGGWAMLTQFQEQFESAIRTALPSEIPAEVQVG